MLYEDEMVPIRKALHKSMSSGFTRMIYRSPHELQMISLIAGPS